MPTYDGNETCSYCGVEYPRPISHHHTEEECEANQPGLMTALCRSLDAAGQRRRSADSSTPSHKSGEA